jgi:hypothetical protein
MTLCCGVDGTSNYGADFFTAAGGIIMGTDV